LRVIIISYNYFFMMLVALYIILIFLFLVGLHGYLKGVLVAKFDRNIHVVHYKKNGKNKKKKILLLHGLGGSKELLGEF